MNTEREPVRARAGDEPTVVLPADQARDRAVLARRYELSTVLGRGAVGTVYLARDLVLHRAVAVKLFRPDAAIDQSGRYEHEARLLASLSHPGLVTVFDAGIDASVGDEPKPYLVMELVTGATLADRLGQGPVSVAQAAALGGQLAVALAYVHGRGVVHRDVKPANVLLAAGENPEVLTAKLTDFGIARLVDSTRMTMHGLTLGTPNYLSPEQATGGEVGPPSDIYSLGLVLLECVTGEIVYPGHGVEAAVTRLHRPPSFPNWLDPGLTRLLAAMTHSDPGQRPSAGEAAEALAGPWAQAPDVPAATLAGMQTQVLRVAAADGSTRLLPASPQRRPGRRRWWFAAAVALVAVVIVLVVVVTGTWSAPSTVGPPAYPSVPGPLGTHLQQLEHEVQP